MLALLLTNGVLLYLSPAVQAYYLVEPLVVLGSAVLATLVILGWSGLAGRKWQDMCWWIISVVASLLLASLLAWQTVQIVWPRQFSPQDFGIAVAYFGEGPELKPSGRGREVTYDLIERLTYETQKSDSALSNVSIGEMGIARSSSEARRSGQRLGADLVVWGRLIVGEEGAITVHFEILETPASALHPEYPRALPIGYAYSAALSSSAVDVHSTHYFEVKEALFEQSNAIIYFILGLAHYLERDFDQAILRLEASKEALNAEREALVQDSSTDLGLVHYYLGQSYQMLGLREKAVEELEEAAQLNGRDPAARISLAYGYTTLGREEEAEIVAREAVVLCEDVLRSSPNSVEALYDLGLAYQGLRENDRALDAYRSVLEVNPDFHIAHISVGRILVLEGRLEDAIAVYKQAIEKAEKESLNGAWAHVDLGDAYLKQGNTRLALDEYLAAARLEPEQDWMHFRLAQFYQVQGEIDLAWEEYEQLLKCSADQVWANAVLGDFLREQRLFDLAIESYRKASSLNSEDAVLYARLGETYLDRYLSPDGQESDAGAAEKAFDEALAKLPEHSPIWFYVFAPRGRLYFHQQRFDLAIANFTSALEINPLSPEILFSLARAYDAAGDMGNACEAYQKVQDPDIDAQQEWVAYAQERWQVLCDQ